MNTPFADNSTGQPHTLGSYLALMQEIVNGTNANIAAGRLAVQLPAGLSGMVAEMGGRALDDALQAFRDSTDAVIEGVSGAETREGLQVIFAEHRRISMSRYDDAMRGFHRFPSTQAAKAGLADQIQARIAHAETLHAARAQVLAEAEGRRIATAARLVAEATARAAEEASRIATAARLAAEVAARAAAEELRVQASRIVHQDIELREVDTGSRERRDTYRKTRWHKLSKRDTVYSHEFASYRIDARDKRVRGDGSVDCSEWRLGANGTVWRDIGNESMRHE